MRSDILPRLRERHPALAPADLAAGSAAFDPARRAQAERNTPAPGAAEAIEAGRQIWTRKFANGRSLAGCFPNGGRRIAAAYPQYDPRVKRLVTLETAINQCLKTHGQPLLDAGDPAHHGRRPRLPALARRRARRSPCAWPRRRRRSASRRAGASTSRAWASRTTRARPATSQHAGQVLRRRRHPGGGRAPARSGPILRDGRAVTLQMRMRECLDRMGAAPFPAGSDELAHLEYFLTYLSQRDPDPAERLAPALGTGPLVTNGKARAPARPPLL